MWKIISYVLPTQVSKPIQNVDIDMFVIAFDSKNSLLKRNFCIIYSLVSCVLYTSRVLYK